MPKKTFPLNLSGKFLPKHTIILKSCVLLATFFLIAGCSRDKSLNREMVLMGTTVRISIVEDSIKIQQAMDEAFALLKKYDDMLSFYNEYSKLSRINKYAAKAPQPVSDDMFEIINKSLYYCKITGGAFDVTATSLQTKGGYGSIRLDKRRKMVHFKNPKLKIDLGGIAVGFCVDKVVEYFNEHKINNFLIDVGGDVFAKGKNKQGDFWRIGVRNPFKHNELIEQFELKDEAATTSGNYVKNHIVDTALHPVATQDILSVTVIAKKCIEADVLATAFFVMGLEKTEIFLEKHPDIKAIFVINKNNKPELVRIGSF